MKEVKQPNIEVPDPEEAISWATISIVKTQWLRAVAPQLGLETKPLVVGDVIVSIVGDDYGAIGLGIENQIPSNPDVARVAKEMLLVRLRWELSVTELPTKLKDMIALTITHIERYDFRKPRQFKKAKQTWIVFKEEVQKLVDKSDSLTAAFEYCIDNGELVNKYWGEFLSK